MYYTTKQFYTPPRVLQETEVLLERNLLNASVVESLNAGGVYTVEQEVVTDDLETGDFNFRWE